MLAIDWLAVVVIILEVLAVLTVAVFVSANRKPSSAIAWVLAAIFIPVLGIVFFLLVGAGRLPRHRREKQRTVNETILARTEGGLDKVSNRGEWPDWLPSMVTLNRNLGALPMIGGNRATLIEDYFGSIEAMAADIDCAKSIASK